LADALGLAVHDVATSQVRRVFRWDAARGQRAWAVDERASPYALVRERVDAGGRWMYRYLRVDDRGGSSLLFEARQPLRDVLLDRDGALVFSAAYDGAAYDTVVRRHHDGTTREVVCCPGISQCRLLSYQDGGDTLWLVSDVGEQRAVLQRWTAGDGRRTTVHADPARTADVGDVLPAPDGGWLAVAYEPDRRHWHGRDPAIESQLAALARRLPGANLALSSSADGTRWLVRASRSSDSHGRSYVYAPATDALQPLFDDDAGSGPDAAQLSPARPVSWRASDGMLLHGYVWLPRGIDPATAPIVAWPHGGPFTRNRDEYSAIAQLLANRGCIVFAPNFRGSRGYGHQYLEAARGDFGDGRVLADIVGGLDVLIAQGIGARDRQAIVGHSFGGYAALLAATHHPKRFRFAYASAAPVDFHWGLQWIADNGGSAIPEDGPPAELFFRHHGVPLADTAWREKMKRESPLSNASALAAPVYLWAGKLDDRVALVEVAAFAGEARRLGRTVSLVIDPAAGHSPDGDLALEALLYGIERAASNHFGTALTPPSAELAAFLARNTKL
ncbi:MAG TPA: prolyl oligopeptidase family serine peptidase, partial [Xanthomonadales bacterium]|nr:prolyl oligopeptidase family serine peptidase [Xanthomonadales bacterium]